MTPKQGQTESPHRHCDFRFPCDFPLHSDFPNVMIMMQRRLSSLSLLLLLLLSTIITKETNAFTSATSISRRLNVGATFKLASVSNNNNDNDNLTPQELKITLLDHIKTLRSIKDQGW